MSQKDTIVAISTALGEGGIGIVRLSGENAIGIAEKIFSPKGKKKLSNCASHTVHYGYIKEPKKDQIVDEVLVTIMKGPRTYTTEDVIEINCHGGLAPLKKVMDMCLRSGARLAQPGEFTKRAFLKGRIDLSQAEAVLDIIKAETGTAERIAASQLKGDFSKQVRDLRSSIIDILSSVELSIDFSDQNVEFAQISQITEAVGVVMASISSLVDTAKKGVIFKEGVSVVICGRPNVGKSSLMNALLRDDRVIVTPVAGTTRDVVEEAININGVKARLSDTAGIIETRDRVEIEGVKRSKQKLTDADVIIFILDSSRKLSGKDVEIFDTIKDKKIVIVANKTDLSGQLDINDSKKKFNTERIIKVSALKKKGLKELEDAIALEIFDKDVKVPEGIIVTNLRHKELLEGAHKALVDAKSNTADNYNGELLSSDLKEAVYKLGLIIGEDIDDSVLDRIFSNFCIGK